MLIAGWWVMTAGWLSGDSRLTVLRLCKPQLLLCQVSCCNHFALLLVLPLLTATATSTVTATATATMVTGCWLCGWLVYTDPCCFRIG